MAFFPSLSYLSQHGGELHRKGSVGFKARLSEWERELQYLRFRIAEWKQFASADHADYYGFRSFLLRKIRNQLQFELRTLSTILMACEAAAESDDIPPLQSNVDSIFAFRERISPGEITRRLHLEEWHTYTRMKGVEMDDTESQMDDMFAKMRNEIGGMERRSKEFKLMVDELVRMVADMQEISKLRQGGGGLQIQPDGFVNVNGFWIRSTTRIPPYAAHRREAAGVRAMTRSPSDVLPMPILANSRARLPPLTGMHPTSPAPPFLPTAGSTNSQRRIPRSISSVSRSRRQQAGASSSSSAVISRRTVMLPSSPSRSRSRSRSHSPPPSPPPPRTAARNIHQRILHVFHMSPISHASPRHRTRTPSPAARSPSPRGSQHPTPPQHQPSGSGFSSYESPSANLIAETRTRLPPPPESSPIPYRPPGQRLFSFLHRL